MNHNNWPFDEQVSKISYMNQSREECLYRSPIIIQQIFRERAQDDRTTFILVDRRSSSDIFNVKRVFAASWTVLQVHLRDLDLYPRVPCSTIQDPVTVNSKRIVWWSVSWRRDDLWKIMHQSFIVLLFSLSSFSIKERFNPLLTQLAMLPATTIISTLPLSIPSAFIAIG